MSTILRALRKLEKDQAERQFAATPELEGEMAAREESAGSRPWRYFALVTAAVLLSGVAGVWVTLAGLSYWQASLFDSESGAVAADVTPDRVAGVAADPATDVAPSKSTPVAASDRAEEPTIVIAADILKRWAAASEMTRDTLALGMRPVQSIALSEPLAPTVDSVESLPIAIISRKPNPASRLAAAREARVSRAPKHVVPPLAREEPAPTRREPVKIASLRVEAAQPESVQEPAVSAAVLPEIRPKIAPEIIPEIVHAPVPSVVVMSTTWHPRSERRRAELSVEEDGKTRTLELREGDFIGPLRISEIGLIGVTFVIEGVEIEHRVGGTHR
jgi:hypothetical protein